MATIHETKQICDNAGLTYDGITIGMTNDALRKMYPEYDLHCRFLEIDDHMKPLSKHELALVEKYSLNKSKKKRFWSWF